MNTASREFQDHIAEIYLTSISADLRDFRQQALSAVQWMLGFPVGCWGLLSPDGFYLHRCADIGLAPAQFLRLAGQVTVWMDRAGVRERGDIHTLPLGQLAEVDERLGAYAGSLYWRRSERQAITFAVALYDEAPPELSTESTDALSALLLHISTAYSHALIRSVSAPSDRRKAERQGVAVLDGHGYVYEANPMFWEIVRDHWPRPSPNRIDIALSADGRAHSSKADQISYMCREIDGLLAVRVWRNGPLDDLTERELQIVYRVCRGLTYKEVARELDLAPSTIANRLYRIYDKLEIRGKPELVRMVRARNAGRY